MLQESVAHLLTSRVVPTGVGRPKKCCSYAFVYICSSFENRIFVVLFKNKLYNYTFFYQLKFYTTCFSVNNIAVNKTFDINNSNKKTNKVR